ncbi:helix-turn-helix transcriptional regulator [Actinomadura sp. 9N215]|uniref:helix-turn-helix transcriptional regulator n=1 Tax=Actinomadura sp. 9N215 TaxID=3375150 RepID=UPI00379BF2E7
MTMTPVTGADGPLSGKRPGHVIPVTFPELFDLPTVVDLRTAGRALGISIGTAYKLVRRHDFPCPVMRLGHRYQVPTAGLLKALHIDAVPVYGDHVDDGADFAARTG